MLRTRNNTDGNKLVIFSGIALYYGDTYIILRRVVDSVSCNIPQEVDVLPCYCISILSNNIPGLQ